MVEDSRIHLQEGQMSVMWKDTTFNYAYFLWFEDSSVSLLLKVTAFVEIKKLKVSLHKNHYEKTLTKYFVGHTS